MRRINKLLALLIIPLLGGCSLAPVMDQDVVDYFRVNDLASNRIILLNILRAKDGAPLHFSELSLVRGQLSAGATASTTFPFGPLAHATTSPRQLATLGTNVSTSPSFDIASLDTQDFTKGVMSPITPQTVEFFLNEGVDYRVVLMVLSSGIRLAGNGDTLLNVPGSSRVVCYDHVLGRNEMPTRYTVQVPNEPCPGTSEREYYGFLRAINNMRRLYAISRRQRRPIGNPFSLDMTRSLRQVAALDPKKYTLQRLPSGQYQLMAVAQGDSTILCEESSGGAPLVVSTFAAPGEAGAGVAPNACIPGDSPEPADGKSRIDIGTTPGTFVISLRSTLGVIQYIGQILAFQEEESRGNPNGLERCITLEYEPLDGPTCNGGVLFRLQHGINPAIIDVDYGGEPWSLPAPRACTQANRCDHTLEVMSIVSLLLNQNKSAKEIGSTPAFQAVP